MKKLHPYSLLFVAVCAALLHLATPAARAADANPPGKLTYQGFLTDASGVPLGNTTPINTNIIFRIYTAATGGTLKWSESQVVTLDKGHFSALLGEGSAVAGETAAYTNNLSGIFTGVDASDRFMQISVGAGIIAPRLQFLPAPYALLARSANQVVSPAGANILSVIANGNVGINNASPVSALDVGGTVTATAFSGNGALLSAINAAAVTSGTLNNARTTATDANTASAIVARDASGNFTAGAITATTFSGSGASLTSLNASQVSSGTLDNARTTATSFNTANAIVARDSGGNLAAGQVVANSFKIKDTQTLVLYNASRCSMFNNSPITGVTQSRPSPNTGTARANANDIPTWYQSFNGNGALLYTATFVVPAGEIWEVNYTCNYHWNTDDASSIVWTLNEVPVEDIFSGSYGLPVGSYNYGQDFILGSGTHVARVKAIIGIGSGPDIIQFPAPANSAHFMVRKYKAN